jgi:hypothetical protein
MLVEIENEYFRYQAEFKAGSSSEPEFSNLLIEIWNEDTNSWADITSHYYVKTNRTKQHCLDSMTTELEKKYLELKNEPKEYDKYDGDDVA